MKISTTVLEIGSLLSLPAIISLGVIDVYPSLKIILIVFGALCALTSFICIGSLFNRYK